MSSSPTASVSPASKEQRTTPLRCYTMPFFFPPISPPKEEVAAGVPSAPSPPAGLAACRYSPDAPSYAQAVVSPSMLVPSAPEVMSAFPELMSEPVATGPAGIDLLCTEAMPVESMTMEPMPAEPVTMEPMPAEPVTMEPMPAEPVTMEPMPAEPMATEPMVVDRSGSEGPLLSIPMRRSIKRKLEINVGPFPVEHEIDRTQFADDLRMFTTFGQLRMQLVHRVTVFFEKHNTYIGLSRLTLATTKEYIDVLLTAIHPLGIFPKLALPSEEDRTLFHRFLVACVEMTTAFGTVLGELFTTAMRNEPTSSITEDAAALVDGIIEAYLAENRAARDLFEEYFASMAASKALKPIQEDQAESAEGAAASPVVESSMGMGGGIFTQMPAQ